MSDEEKGYEVPAWLLTYGDMITLLVTFFVMLISLSTINVNKFKEKMSQVPESFGGESILEGGRTLIENESFVPKNMEVRREEDNFIASEEVFDYLSGFIKESGLAKFIIIEDIKIGCKIKIPMQLCFEEGKSDLKWGAQEILKKLAATLARVKGGIVIDTNFAKAIRPNIDFEKEMNLSIDRAVSIRDYLVNKEDVDFQRVGISGHRIGTISEEDIIGVVVLKK